MEEVRIAAEINQHSIESYVSSYHFSSWIKANLLTSLPSRSAT